MLAFVLTLVVLQLWLLTATMNAYLGGDETVIWPAAGAACVSAAERRPLEVSPTDGTSPLVTSRRCTRRTSRWSWPPASSRWPRHLAGIAGHRAALLGAQRRLLRRVVGADDPALRALSAIASSPTCSTTAASVGFFTTVAATCVLGSQSWLIAAVARRPRALDGRHRALGAGDLRRAHGPDGESGQSRRSPRASTAGGWSRSSRRSRSRCSARSSRRGFGRYAPQVLFFCLAHVARRRDALHLDHLADFLSLHVLSADARPTWRRRTGSTWARSRSPRSPERCS